LSAIFQRQAQKRAGNILNNLIRITWARPPQIIMCGKSSGKKQFPM